jgi:hypothetical protein
VDRELGRIRTGDQVDRAEQVQKLGLGEPFPALHDLAVHHRDVSGGATEADGPETQK